MIFRVFLSNPCTCLTRLPIEYVNSIKAEQLYHLSQLPTHFYIRTMRTLASLPHWDHTNF